VKKELDKMKIGGVILSGGKSRRMKSDKSFKKINNIPLIEIVLSKSMKQLDYVFINSNNLEQYNFKGMKIDVVKDCMNGFLGPLVGVLTGMKWLRAKNSDFTHLMSFPVDSPFFPNDIVLKFGIYKNKYQIISANSSNRNHPVFSLWDLKLEEELEFSLRNGTRKIDEFTRKKKTKVVKFKNFGYDPFFNINTEEDLNTAESRVLERDT
tara:strand:+ start:1074 stop:1700 length:627 start_codon:yes stop_codon:yes gene_type:complete